MYSFFLSYVHSITRAFLNTNTYNPGARTPKCGRTTCYVTTGRPVEASTLPANALPTAGLPRGFQTRLAA